MTDVLLAAPVMDDPADLERGTAAAERIRREARDADLDLYESAEKAFADATTLLAGIVELRERLRSGLLGSDARYDLGADLYELSSAIQTFTLGVFK